MNIFLLVVLYKSQFYVPEITSSLNTKLSDKTAAPLFFYQAQVPILPRAQHVDTTTWTRTLVASMSSLNIELNDIISGPYWAINSRSNVSFTV